MKQCKSLPRHKNIITVLDTFTTSNNYYIMMEKGGVDLKTLLMKKKVLAEEQVLGVMVDLLEGLKHLHASGVMYCNLKPSNVVLVGNTAKLIDFALVRKLNS